MKRVTLHQTARARVLIVAPSAGCYERVIPLTVAALIVWFLGCIPAQAVGVVLFGQVVGLRRWLRGWADYWQGWRDDLRVMWVALAMTARLEFA